MSDLERVMRLAAPIVFGIVRHQLGSRSATSWDRHDIVQQVNLAVIQAADRDSTFLHRFENEPALRFSFLRTTAAQIVERAWIKERRQRSATEQRDVNYLSGDNPTDSDVLELAKLRSVLGELSPDSDEAIAARFHYGETTIAAEASRFKVSERRIRQRIVSGLMRLANRLRQK